jgi:TolB-like protein
MGVAATIAVLPFDNPSGDPAQAYVARGFVDELVTELSRFPSVELIHPQTSFAAGEPSDLGATHYLRGSVRRLGEIIRIGAQLIAVDGGRQIWADRFDAPADRVLDVQDEIVSRVASVLALELDGARLRGARRKPLASLDVYDCWLRGLDCLRQGTLADDERARRFFERALSLDPYSARAHAGMSLSHFNEWSCQAWEMWDEKEQLAFDHAQRATALDDRDGIVQVVLGRILMFRRRFDEAARHVERAVELNPNDADVLAHAGMCLAFLGDAAAGAELATKARRLNPRHPDWYVPCAAVPLFLLERHAEAAALLATAPRAMVDLPAYMAAAHALLGDRERATAALEMFTADFVEKVTFGRAPEPGEPLRWLLHVNPFRRSQDADLLARGLALAGLAADPDTSPAVSVAVPSSAAFTHDDGQWTLVFDGTAVRLGDAKGFHDLALLLAQPGAPIHCLELAGRSAEPRGDAPVFDDQARRELAARVRTLEEMIEEAESRNDLGRADRARSELDQIVSELSAALGIGGRTRRLGSAAERARSAVTWRIRNAIRKIASVHPSLGRHLDHAIRTGTHCTYEPETPVEWAL